MTKEKLLLENHDMKRVIREQAKKICELGGEGYHVPLVYENRMMFNSPKYGDILTCPLDDVTLTSEKSFMGGNSIETLERAYERE
jgi:hypothetical protein